MIMEATIEVEYQGKKYLVDHEYWNNDKWNKIVLRNEKHQALDQSLTVVYQFGMDDGCNFIPKSEVKLWEEPKVECNNDLYVPVLYKGKKFYILKAWRDSDSILLCPNTSGSSGEVFVSREKLHPFMELTPVKWKESDKTYYVRSDRLSITYSWKTLRNKNGIPYITNNSGSPVKDKTASRRWFYAQHKDLKKVEII